MLKCKSCGKTVRDEINKVFPKDKNKKYRDKFHPILYVANDGQPVCDLCNVEKLIGIRMPDFGLYKYNPKRDILIKDGLNLLPDDKRFFEVADGKNIEGLTIIKEY